MSTQATGGYVTMPDPSQYRFYADENFPDSIHNFKLIFLIFLIVFCIFRALLRWKENDILSKEVKKRNVVCVNVSRETARCLTRDHLLRFLARLYARESRVCGKVFLPSSIKKENIRTAFIFPNIEQNDLIQHLDKKYRSLIPLPKTHNNTTTTTTPTTQSQFKTGQVVSFEFENDTTTGQEHEPTVLVTFFVNSISDAGASVVFPFLGVKTSSIYSYYEKYYGSRNEGIYLVPGNGLFPSRSGYQHGNMRDTPSGKERLKSYHSNQNNILRQWLHLYKNRLARGRIPGITPVSLENGTITELTEEEVAANKATHIQNQSCVHYPFREDQLDTLNIPNNNTRDSSRSSLAPNQSNSPQSNGNNNNNAGGEIELGDLTKQQQQQPQQLSPQSQNGDQDHTINLDKVPSTDTDDSPSSTSTNNHNNTGPRSPLLPNNERISTNNSNNNGTDENSYDQDAQSIGVHDPSMHQGADLTIPNEPPPPAPQKHVHVSGVYTAQPDAVKRRIHTYFTDPRYARSGRPFALLPTECPIDIKAQHTLAPITIKNTTKNPNGSLATIRIPLSMMDKLVQTKYKELEESQQDKKFYHKSRMQDQPQNIRNDAFLPLVLVTAGTVGDCLVSEIVHFDFTQAYTHDLFPQRHYLHLPRQTNEQQRHDGEQQQSSEDGIAVQITSPASTINPSNLIDVVDSVLSTQDLYNPEITDHVNPDTINYDDEEEANAAPKDTRLPLEYQLLRSGRVVTPFYHDIYDLKRSIFTVIETGLMITSDLYTSYLALFPTFGLAQDSDGTDCNICYCEPKRVIALPCRHIATCNECAKQLVKCCLCRSDITSFCYFSAMDENNKERKNLNTTEGPDELLGQLTQQPQADPQDLQEGETINEDGNYVLNGIIRTPQQRAMYQYLQEQARLEREQLEQQNQNNSSVFGTLMRLSQQPNPATGGGEDLALGEDYDEGEDTHDDEESVSMHVVPTPVDNNVDTPTALSRPTLDFQTSVHTPPGEFDSESEGDESDSGIVIVDHRASARYSVRQPIEPNFGVHVLETHAEEEE